MGLITGGLIAGVLFLLFAFLKRQKVELDSKKWQKVPGTVKQWVPTVKDIAGRYGVPEPIALGVLWTENKGRMLPDGADGEKGIMQVKEIAVKDLRFNGYSVPNDWKTDPVSNITVGIQYLHLQNSSKRTVGNWEETIKAYNQGFRGKDLNPKRANNYLAKVQDKIAQLPYG